MLVALHLVLSHITIDLSSSEITTFTNKIFMPNRKNYKNPILLVVIKEFIQKKLLTIYFYVKTHSGKTNNGIRPLRPQPLVSIHIQIAKYIYYKITSEQDTKLLKLNNDELPTKD